MKKNNIILIGFMGCGKTSVGHLLSRILQYHFIDTDSLIEEKEKRTIKEIFATDGESVFRQMETECIKDLLREENQVPMIISVGGGLVLKKENQELLKELGTVIFLDASDDTLYERLKQDTSRPLLQTENPKERISSLLLERKPIYEESSTIIIDVNNSSILKSANEIIDVLGLKK